MEFRPFRVGLTTPFRGVVERHGVLVRDTAPDGSTAWGEYAPFPDYDAARAGRWWRAALEAARGDHPAPVREAVAVNSIVPEVGPAEAARLAVAGGCRTAKVKVAGRDSSIGDDAERVEAAAAAVGSGGRVRIDANGGWERDQAVRAIRQLDRAARSGGVEGLEYVEQPCATVEDLAWVRRHVDIPVAADESIRVPDDPMAVMRAEAADVVIVKVAPLGGVRACLDLADAVGVPVVVSSALETSVGLAAGLALARALPELPYACGLGTSALLAEDVVADRLAPADGMLVARPLEVTV